MSNDKTGISRREALKGIGVAAAAAGTLVGSGVAASSGDSQAPWKGDPAFGNFNFGLNDDQEARARRLHGDAIIVDMMHQGAGGYLAFEEPDVIRRMKKLAGLKGFALLGAAQPLLYEQDISGESDMMRQRWRRSGVTCGTMGVSVGNVAGSASQIHLIDSLDWLRKATRAEHLRAAKRDGVHALVGYDQPVFGLPKNLSAIEEAYRIGLRCLMLTYNSSDFVGAGCTERVDHGLTYFGLDVVRRCNELGVMIDTAHTGKATTLDACKHSNQPVLANHTSAEGVHLHDRAKSDDEIKAIAGTGGLIGIHAVPFFMAKDRQADMNDMLNHIDYVAELVGWEHVGLGTDWPLTAPKSALDDMFSTAFNYQIGFYPQHNIIPTMNLNGFDDYRDFPNITRGMVSRGYSDEQIKGVLGENFMRVFEQVCG